MYTEFNKLENCTSSSSVVQASSNLHGEKIVWYVTWNKIEENETDDDEKYEETV